MSDTLYKMATSPYAPGTLAHTSYYKPSGSWPTSSGSGTTGSKTPTTPTDTSTDADKPTPLTEASSFFDEAPEWTYYNPMSESDMLNRATEFGDIYSQPLYNELQYKLEQAIADAAAQEARIRGAYAGTEDLYGRRETEQGRRDLESAISRGAGRSGVVDWQSGQRQEHFSELLAAEEAKKNAELYAIANQLGLVQRQVPDQRMQISEQVGRLVNQELQRLSELEYARGREHDLDQWTRMLSVFDRSQLTPAEQLAAYIQLAGVMGETGEMPSMYGTY